MKCLLSHFRLWDLGGTALTPMVLRMGTSPRPSQSESHWWSHDPSQATGTTGKEVPSTVIAKLIEYKLGTAGDYLPPQGEVAQAKACGFLRTSVEPLLQLYLKLINLFLYVSQKFLCLCLGHFEVFFLLFYNLVMYLTVLSKTFTISCGD